MSNSIFILKNNQYRTPDGKTFSNEIDANSHCDRMRQKISESIGRTITDSEWNLQRIKAATDSRDYNQKYYDENFKVRQSKELTSLERRIAAAQADVEAAHDPYEGLSPAECRLFDLKKIQARELQAEENSRAKEIHLKAIAPQLKALDELIFEEHWSPNSDEAFRQQLHQARETLIDPNHDTSDAQQRLKSIDDYLTDRSAELESSLLEQQAAAEATLAKIREKRGLFTPEPKPEHQPSPNSYPDPMAGYEPESEQEQETFKATIDRKQALGSQMFELTSKAFESDWPLSVRQEILTAKQSLRDGNETPAMEALAKYTGE